MDSQRKNIKLPHVMLEMFPKEAYTGSKFIFQMNFTNIKSKNRKIILI